MILTVTLNPCLDKTLTVPEWAPGDSVRGRDVRTVVGGKGNNVARALRRLGRTARPVTFLGGPTGQLCEGLLRGDDGLDPLVTPTAAETRTILTVRTESSAAQTAFFDPDPEVRPAEAGALAHAVEAALDEGRAEALTLSGSSPSEATHGLYSELIALARARRVPVFLDAYGPALDAIWGFWPTAIQLNRREAGLHLRKPDPSEADLLGLLRRWSRHGVLLGIITDGAGPVLVQHRGRLHRALPPPITPVNPIGSGDCLLAGAVDAWLSNPGHDAESLVRHALGCAVANALVWDAGAIDPEEVKTRARAVVVEPLASA
jgi:tagatose 6-phosphate kinase